ncbi:CoA-binding protein [Thermohalobacter berrensis]|uniref:CoA-binding protein n=1 Tax=Thermohalobacter berrensis TaxID=99594 RepID=A0A419TB11_9FIRM|nr:CoA-binding protein [Thermohalobacter berrensis]RKD34678.1 CoA-binding protein [Thermohalobacter berrensis]
MDNIEKNKKEMLDKKVWAVVGATPNKDKYGYKIWNVLKEHGYIAYPVNPKYEEIEGEKCYPSVEELPEKVDVIDFVVPPKVTKKIIEQADKVGIEYLWFQPGTFDEEIIEKAEKLNKKIVYYDCVLAELTEK